MSGIDIEAFEARAAEAERRLAALERKERHASSGAPRVLAEVSAALHSVKADLLQAKTERMKLVAKNERLSTDIAKQKYRVDGHILPYIEKLREENAELKAALHEHCSGGVPGASSGVSKLSLSAA